MMNKEMYSKIVSEIKGFGWYNIQESLGYIFASGSKDDIIIFVGKPSESELEDLMLKAIRLGKTPWSVMDDDGDLVWKNHSDEMTKNHYCSIGTGGERRVFKINVGEIDPDKVEEYVKGVAERLKQQPNYIIHNYSPHLSKWEVRWMERAKAVAEYSKDTNTKTGAVIVTDDNTELTMGYNGFPRGANDIDYPKRYERPEKYFWTEHAERNAIYKAARIGMSVKGANMFCTYFPCADCSRAIIQAGIKKLYTEKPDFNHERWGESWLEATIMLKECGVELVWTDANSIFDE